ncbi:hypothetical protein ACP4OV_020434 [Aristida adscensionis]
MTARSGGGGDRLSGLPDATLTRVLSHLPTDEAVRTSALSRRWRLVFAAVPVVHLVDRRSTKKPPQPRRGYRRWGNDGGEPLPACFEQHVACALLCRNAAAPIRAFRVSARRRNPSAALLDQWVLHALSSGAEEIAVALVCDNSPNQWLCPFAAAVEGSSSSPAALDQDQHVALGSLPRRVFGGGGSSSLRRLRLTNVRLDLPRGAISLGSLETLHLKRVAAPDGGAAVQRLIAACPRLADLALEQCPDALEITVPSSTNLRRFAMACCHNATLVALDTPTPCLRSLRYKGGVPGKQFRLLVANCTQVASLSIDICKDIAGRRARDVAAVPELIGGCAGLTFLGLSLRPSMAYFSRMIASAMHGIHGLRRLELRGYVADGDTIQAVINLLHSAGHLEELTLFPLAPKQSYFSESDSEYDDSKNDDEEINYGGDVFVPKGLWTARIRCLQQSLRRIVVVNYKGRPVERTLMKLLLSKAVVLDELRMSFHPGCAAKHQDELKGEMSSWILNQKAKAKFAHGKKN